MYIAIAAIVDKDNNCLGARLFNIETGKIIDKSVASIVDFLNKGGKVRNLDVKNNKGMVSLEWKQGIMGRYPMLTPGTTSVKNPNYATVIGYFENGNTKMYKIVDYSGRQATPNEGSIISYAKKNGLTNCKVVNKDGIGFIQSLSGELDKLDSNVKIRVCGYDSDIIEVRLPKNGTISELLIPDIIEGFPIRDIKAINIIGDTSTITKLTIGKCISNLTHDMISLFPNIKELSLLGDDITIEKEACSYMLHLCRVNILNARSIKDRAFLGCLNLKEVNIKHCQVIKNRAFDDCPVLDAQKLLNGNVQHLPGLDIFSLSTPVDLHVSKDVEELNIGAFRKLSEGCRVYVEGVATVLLFPYNGNPKHKHNLQLYVSSKNVYIDRIFKHVKNSTWKLTYLDWIDFHFIRATGEDEETVKRIRKMSLLGKPVVTEAATTPEDILTVINLVKKPNELRNGLIRELNSLSGPSKGVAYWNTTAPFIELSGQAIQFDYIRDPNKSYNNILLLKHSIRVKDLGKVVCYFFKEKCLVVAVEQELIKKILEHRIEKGVELQSCVHIPSFSVPIPNSTVNVALESDKLHFYNKNNTFSIVRDLFEMEGKYPWNT